MERIRSIIIILLLSSMFMGIYGQDVFQDVPTSTLPSEETYKAIENGNRAPGLRARPGDIVESEKPQKVPVRGFDIIGIAILGMSIFIYSIYKTQTKRNLEL